MKNKMMTLATAIALTASAFALETILPEERVTATLRPDSFPYVGIFSGGALAGGGDGEYSDSLRGTRGSYDVDLKSGWLLGVKGGLELNGWQYDGWALRPMLELEGTYLSSATDSTFDVGGSSIREADSLMLGVFMANAIIKFENPYLSPYLGAGLGLGVLHTDDKVSEVAGVSNTLEERHDTNFSLATQGIFGLEHRFTPNLSLFGEYKYLWLTEFNTEYDYRNGSRATSPRGTIGDKYQNLDFHLLTVGLRYGF